MVSPAPIRAAWRLASTAASPREGPTVPCSMTSTGTGRAPALTNSANSPALSSSKFPVIRVPPPVIPTSHGTEAATPGLERTVSSRTMAIRLVGSP